MSNPSRFVWHDLSTPDVEGAQRFYGELFDWGFDRSGNDPYVHLSTGGRMIGGIRRKEADEPGPPAWLGYVLVEDVAAATERATGAGGRVYVPATTLPDVGTFSVIADPTGGVLAPWRSARAEENEAATEAPAVHSFCWDELMTSDPASATAFYERVFGWSSEVRDMGEWGEYTLLTRPGTTDPRRDGAPEMAAGLMKSPPEMPYSFWMAYVRVEDADATAERAERLGAKLLTPPTDIPTVGRFGVFSDPAGASLAFIRLADA